MVKLISAEAVAIASGQNNQDVSVEVNGTNASGAISESIPNSSATVGTTFTPMGLPPCPPAICGSSRTKHVTRLMSGTGASADEVLDAAQTALEIGGMIPGAEVLDAASALVSLMRGNKEEAILGIAAMAPIGGQVATGIKWSRRFENGLDAGKSLKTAYKETVEEATKKHGGNVTVQRDGQDLFRVHQPDSGHGLKVNQTRNNTSPDGVTHKNRVDVPMRKSHYKKLKRALKGDPRYKIRTKGRR